jgi:hypothetical protein
MDLPASIRKVRTDSFPLTNPKQASRQINQTAMTEKFVTIQTDFIGTPRNLAAKMDQMMPMKTDKAVAEKPWVEK